MKEENCSIDKKCGIMLRLIFVQVQVPLLPLDVMAVMTAGGTDKDGSDDYDNDDDGGNY